MLPQADSCWWDCRPSRGILTARHAAILRFPRRGVSTWSYLALRIGRPTARLPPAPITSWLLIFRPGKIPGGCRPYRRRFRGAFLRTTTFCSPRHFADLRREQRSRRRHWKQERNQLCISSGETVREGLVYLPHGFPATGGQRRFRPWNVWLHDCAEGDRMGLRVGEPTGSEIVPVALSL